jgi:hypothetical protein
MGGASGAGQRPPLDEERRADGTSALAAAQGADARVVAIVQAPFEAAIATGVDLGDLDGAAGADGGADQR